MSIKEATLPKALNIIRPTLIKNSDYSTSTSSSSPSTISAFSSNSNLISPTIISDYSSFQNTWAHFKSKNPVASPVGVNPYRFLHRPRSNSNLSTRSTYFSTLSKVSNDDDDDDINDYDDDLTSIDGLSDNEMNEEEDDDDDDEPKKVVAKIKNGTILNNKGEFVNKGQNLKESINTTHDDTWLDEARANRKIADLEIEKQSLLLLNTTLEAKLRQQTLQISELQQRLQMSERSLTPVSNKSMDDLLLFDDDTTVVSTQGSLQEDELEHDQVFQRIKSMLENLILQAEVALIQKSKESGKVLQNYTSKDDEKQFHVQETLHKLTKRSSMSRVDNKIPNRQTIASARRASENNNTPLKPTNVKITRTLSRQSSPPVLVTARPSSPSPSPPSPTPSYQKTLQRKSSSLRQSHTKSREQEKAKWNY